MAAVGDDSTASHIEVIVRAMVGRGDQLLLLREHDDDHWFLPGGQVAPGEPIELALRRRVNEILHNEIESASFLAVIEDRNRDRQGNDRHELNIIFDVTLANADVRCDGDHREARWTPWIELSTIDLRPVALRADLRSGRLGNANRWVPWR